ncbi:hypothetical protein [Spirillospora sp. NBC_01491]|nr:hypothetical protein [Spirillospora sp. NBC_01491]
MDGDAVTVIYRLIDGLWQALDRPPVTPPAPPAATPYGRGPYGAGPYGR